MTHRFAWKKIVIAGLLAVLSTVFFVSWRALRPSVPPLMPIWQTSTSKPLGTSVGSDWAFTQLWVGRVDQAPFLVTEVKSLEKIPRPLWAPATGFKPQERSSPIVGAAGWPFRCAFAILDRGPDSQRVQPALRGGYGAFHRQISSGLFDGVIPFRPIPLGLIADLGLHSIAWWLLIFIVGLGRDLLRTRRGLCVHCGYDLDGLLTPVCPECGREHSRVVHG
jgi:hypothetical protein